MSRKTDLEHSIRSSYSLIREYERIIQASGYPEEKVRSRRMVQEQWALIRGYLSDYVLLVDEDSIPMDIAQVATVAKVLPAHDTSKDRVQTIPQKGETQSLPTPASDEESPSQVEGLSDKSAPWYGTKRWGPIIVALIGLLGVLVSVLISQCKGRQLAPSDGDFNYQVRVKSQDTGEFVENAEVTIELSGQAPLNGVTDSNGLVRIFISSDYVNKPAILIVEANGHKMYTENMDLAPGALPDVILLEPDG